ncbi:MAG: hypothetical protein GKS06_08090 [Acidobacteria bacterium]|nr:hypothetical protein [Acidobacteriota bacterium]
MSGLRGLLSVARYERTLLMRTTRYRVLGAAGIGIPIFIGVILAIAEARGGEAGTMFGVGAFVPFYVYSFLQTVVIAFIAGDFRAADERAQVYEVIAVRPLSTTQLVVGKYLGILQGLMVLSFAVMGVTVLVQAAKLSVLGTPFRLEPYLGYLLLMNLPGLIYMTALTFCLGAILRNRTAAALVALAYALGCLIFLGERYGGVFDYGAFYAPLFYSDILGFGDLSRVIELRLLYMALAVALLGLAVERYPRLAQAGLWRWGGRVVALAALAVCVGIGFGIQRSDEASQAERVDFLRAHVTRAAEPIASLVHYDMSLQLHTEQAPLVADVRLRVGNTHDVALGQVVVSLNSGLTVDSIADNAGSPLDFEHDGSVLAITLGAPLEPGAETQLRLKYAGDIDRNGFDLIRTAPRRDRSDGPLRMPQLTSWIREDTVFLPARAGWYPRAGVDYGYDEPPAPSFATANIEVDSPADMRIVTQGSPSSPDSASSNTGSRRTSLFTVDRPVPVFTLNGGRYNVYEARIGGVDMALYLYPEHMTAVSFFDDAADEARAALEQMLGAIVRETGLPYPYERLNLVEVPLVVQWYYEGWREAGGLTGPGVLMIEEDVLTSQNLQRSFNRRQRGADGEFDAAAVKRDLFVQEIFELFMSPESERYGIFRSPLVQLWSYDRAFVGDRSNLLERAMPVYLQQDVGSEVRSMMLSGGNSRPRGREESTVASAEMLAAVSDSGQSQARTGSDWNAVLDAMQKETFADMNPDADPELYRSVVDAKGVSVFRMMRAVTSSDAFVNAIEGFAEESRHEGVDFDDFEAAVGTDQVTAEGPSAAESDSSGEPDMQRLVQSWLEGTAVPGYTITRANVRKLEDGRGNPVHQVIVRVRNGEAALGFVRINAIGFEDEVSKGVQIEGNSEVEVALLIGDRPARVTVDPFFAKNRRSLVAPLRVPDFIQPDQPAEYVRLVTQEASNLVEIVVDNEDEGFSLPTRRVQRYLRPGLQGGGWWVRSTLFSYGRYANNYRMKNGSDGAEPAIWSATMPREGEYDVAYYFLPEATAWARSGVWGLASRIELTIHHRNEVHTVELDTTELNAGWNLLGRFDFEAGAEVRVELSDKASGRLYADAVRWRLADSDLVYEEDVSPWEVQTGSLSGRR